VERIGTHAYKLKLPNQWKNVHLVFRVSKLHLYHKDPKHPNFPPNILEGELEWEVEWILDAKVINRQLKFLAWRIHENLVGT
jgi:hypothetical protein